MPSKQRIAILFQHMSTYLQTGWRRKAITPLFFLLSLIVAFSVLIANWETLKEYQWQLRPMWALYALLFLTIDLFLGSYAWHLLVSRLTPHSNSRFDIKCWLYANLARRVPGPIWYVASRALLYEQKQISKTTTSLISGLELALIFVTGTAIFLFTLPFWVISPEISTQLNQSWLLFVILVGCLIFIHPSVLNKIWAKLSETTPPSLRWHDAIIWFGFYILIWTIGAFVLFCLINLLTPLPFEHLIPMIGIWSLSNIISVAGTLFFSGIGLREISLTLLLTQFVPLPVALLIAIFLRLLWLIGESVGALISLLL